MDHDTARKYLKTYNNDPWIDTPISTLENNRLKIYIDTYKMLGPYTIDITYVKYPQIIDNTQPNTEIDEVPDRVLYEVINRATVIALENIDLNEQNLNYKLIIYKNNEQQRNVDGI